MQLDDLRRMSGPSVLKMNADKISAAQAAHPAGSNRRPKASKLAPLAVVPDPEAQPTRGPWVLEVCGLGRPPTTNSERTSSMGAAKMAEVRQIKRDWDSAVAAQARALRVPALQSVWVTIQPYYPNNVVPDSDGIGPAIKAVFDGLVLAGVIPNDTRGHLPIGHMVLPPFSDTGEPRLVAVVYPLA